MIETSLCASVALDLGQTSPCSLKSPKPSTQIWGKPGEWRGNPWALKTKDKVKLSSILVMPKDFHCLWLDLCGFALCVVFSSFRFERRVSNVAQATGYVYVRPFARLFLQVAARLFEVLCRVANLWRLTRPSTAQVWSNKRPETEDTGYECRRYKFITHRDIKEETTNK